MKILLGIIGMAACVMFPLSAIGQNQRSNDDRPNLGYGIAHDQWRGRLSTEDQSRFDSYYSRWLNYRQTNDADNRNSMEDRMRDVMSHYRVPSDVSFDEVASTPNRDSGVHRGRDLDNAGRGRDLSDYRDRQSLNRLSARDQKRFDSYYSRWLIARRTGNRGEAGNMERRMQDVMSRNSIGGDVPFSDLASGSSGRYRWANVPRFAGNDASDFRSYYSRWREYERTGNRDQTASMEQRMRKVMADNNVPTDASYDDVMDMLNRNGRN